MKLEFLFEIWPYVALAVLVGGFIIRYALSYREGGGFAGELARARTLFQGGALWTLSLLVLFAIHVAVLLLPRQVIAWDSAPGRLYLLEGSGFLFGVLLLIGWARVTWRQLAQSKGSVGAEAVDALFLSLGLVSLISGLFTAGLYRWASAWGAATVTPYLRSLAEARPRIDLLAALPFAVKLHVASAFAVLAILPFSSVAPFLIALLHRLAELGGRPFAAGSRSAEGFFRKHNPAVWIWPEED